MGGIVPAGMDERNDALSAVRDLFADGHPRTATEVATEVGVAESVASRALSDLVAAGELDRKTVGADGSVTVWFPTATRGTDAGNGREVNGGGGETTSAFELRGSLGSVGTDPAGGDPGVATTTRPDVDRAIADVDVPGASEMMRSWRRDALRAAALYVAEQGTVRSTRVIDAIYPGNPAGYERREDWWAFVAERLEGLPGVARNGDVWEFQN